MKNMLFGFIALCTLIATPAAYAASSQDCYTRGTEDLGCAPRNQIPPGLVLQNGDVRTRTTTASDGSYGREVATFVAGPAYGQWVIASQYYPPTAEPAAPRQDCGFLGLGCVHIEAGTLRQAHCSDGGSYYESNSGGRKYRSHSSYYRCGGY